MKRYLFLFLLLPIVSQAQVTPAINVEFAEKTATINDVPITKTSTMADVRKLLGNENRMVSNENDSACLYIYDSLGINFIVECESGVIKKIDIYILRGRREFETSPKKLFSGLLSVNKYPLQLNESIDMLKTKTGLPFEEMLPDFYWYTATKEEFILTIAYRSKLRDRISMAIILLGS